MLIEVDDLGAEDLLLGAEASQKSNVPGWTGYQECS